MVLGVETLNVKLRDLKLCKATVESVSPRPASQNLCRGRPPGGFSAGPQRGVWRGLWKGVTITLHGLIMIFFLVMLSQFGGFGNYFSVIFQCVQGAARGLS